MWRLRRASSCSASLCKWWEKSSSRYCAGAVSGLEREASSGSRSFSYGVLPNGNSASSSVKKLWFHGNSNYRGFATRARRAPAASASEDESEKSESDQLESEADEIEDVDEQSESEDEDEDGDNDEVDDVVNTRPPRKATKESQSESRRNEDRRRPLNEKIARQKQIDQLENELWDSLQKLRKEDSVVPVMEQWREDGKELHGRALSTIIERMRNTNRFTHALELVEYLDKDGSYGDIKIIKPLLIELTARTRGIGAAETLFEELPEEHKNRATYSALLARYVYLEMVSKAEQLFEDMEKAGHLTETPFALNIMMKLYKQKGNTKKFQEMLEKAKETSVEPNIFTYNVMLDLKAKQGDMEGMEKIFSEIKATKRMRPEAQTYINMIKGYMQEGLLEKAELNALRCEVGSFRKSRSNYEFLMGIYGELGYTEGIERVWAKCKMIPGNGFNSFHALQHAMALAGEANRAESIFRFMEKWKKTTGSDTKRHNNLLLAFYRAGMTKQAAALEEKMNEAGLKVTLSANEKVSRTEAIKKSEDKAERKKDKKKNAAETKKDASESKKNASESKKDESKKDARESKKDASESKKDAPESKKDAGELRKEGLKGLEDAAQKGDIVAAEKSLEKCKKAKLNNVECWNKLLKAYLKAKVPAYGFLQRMKTEKVDPDDETHTLLKKLDKKEDLTEENVELGEQEVKAEDEAKNNVKAGKEEELDEQEVKAQAS